MTLLAASGATWGSSSTMGLHLLYCTWATAGPLGSARQSSHLGARTASAQDVAWLSCSLHTQEAHHCPAATLFRERNPHS